MDLLGYIQSKIKEAEQFLRELEGQCIQDGNKHSIYYGGFEDGQYEGRRQALEELLTFINSH